MTTAYFFWFFTRQALRFLQVLQCSFKEHAIAVLVGVVGGFNGNVPLWAVADLMVLFVNQKVTQDDIRIFPEQRCGDQPDIVLLAFWTLSSPP